MTYNGSYFSKSTYPRTTRNWDYDFKSDRNRQTSTAGSTDRYGGSRDPLHPSRVENLALNAARDHTYTTVNDPDRIDRYGGSRDPLQPSKVENLASNATRDHIPTTVTDSDRNIRYGSRDPLQPSRVEKMAWTASRDHTPTPMDVDTSRPTRDQSELDQLLDLVKQMIKIDVDKVESMLKVILSGTPQIDLEKQKADYETLKESHDSLSAKYTEAVTNYEELKSKAKSLIKETKTKAQEDLDSTISHYKSLIKAREEEIKCLKIEKDSALSRLSKEMGDKLSENNTGIADLSDPNRSTKLAEKYNSLYDNEWTDALEILSKTVDEEAGVRYLLEIKKHIYSFCNAAKTELFKDLTGRFANPISGRHTSSDKSGSQEDKEIHKMLETCLKMKAKTAIPNLQKSYLQMGSSKKPTFADQLPEFVNKCIELCWLMNTQSPPLVFGEPLQAGQSVDRDQYKEYTKQGDVVSFVVWLPLLIEKDGGVLSKGVVQPISYSRSSKTENKTVSSADQSKTRSRRETEDEKRQRLLHDTGDVENNRKINPDKKPEKKVQNTTTEQQFSDLLNDNGKNTKNLTEQLMQNDMKNGTKPTALDPKVDELFENARTRTYVHNIGSVASAPSVSSAYDNNTSASTNSVPLFSNTKSFQPKTTNYYGTTTSTTKVKDRPHTAYSENKKETKDYLNRPATSGGFQPFLDTNKVAYMDPKRTEYFSDGRNNYALFEGQFYKQDSRGGWRVTSGFTDA